MSNKIIEANIFTCIFNINYIKCYFLIFSECITNFTNKNIAPNSDLIIFSFY